MTALKTHFAARPLARTLQAAGLGLFALLALSAPGLAGDLTLEAPWARATPDGAKVAGGFLVIRNAGSAPDRLVGGSVPFATSVEVHEMTMEGDVMKMRTLADGLEIPAGGSVELKPGSYHLMFMGLTQPLTEGETVSGTLMFEKAGPVTVDWAVAGLGAKAPASSGHKH